VADQTPGPLGHFFRQFGRPSGLLGQLAGHLMAKLDDDDRWVVGLLDVQPADRVLELGCGPGVAVALLAERAPSGLVAGVDPSEVMIRQAARRNRAAVRAGRVELRLGTASALPYPDGHFTKACTIHSIYFWPSLADGLRELHRVLAPAGQLVVAVRMRRAGAGRFDPSYFGYTEQQLGDLVAVLESIGFYDVTRRRWEQVGRIGRQTMEGLLARR
jgi:ubiquinone/menaquinone biosynthesis C-methylase UbiE